MSDNSVTITNNQTGETFAYPIIEGTLGPKVIDIRNLYKTSGIFTYDPGYTSTASCQSDITYIDGEKGILLHRGYSIEDLCKNCDYLEVAYLLLNNKLPNRSEKEEFETVITQHTMVHDQISTFYKGFRRDAHPMAILCGVAGALSSFYPFDAQNITDPEQVMIAAHRLIAKIPTIASMTYKYSIGQPFVYPNNNLKYADNFLSMCFATPAQRNYTVTPIHAKAIDKIFILHADHEQNASTSTVRLAGSSGAHPFACIAAGMATLSGPAHGGANEAVLNMLRTIKNKDNIPEFIKRAKDKHDPFRLMGFGHRVYKNFDPRAQILRRICHEVLEELDEKRREDNRTLKEKEEDQQTLDIALELERIALQEEYFIERNLYPNVDFYSGIILKALLFPINMFTVLFAVARTAGWIAQWKEMLADPEFRIGRPRQLYNGIKERKIELISLRP